MNALRSTLAIEPGEQLAAGRLGDVAGSDGDGLNPTVTAGVDDVKCVLQKDHRIVVGHGDAAAAEPVRCLGNARNGMGYLSDPCVSQVINWSHRVV